MSRVCGTGSGTWRRSATPSSAYGAAAKGNTLLNAAGTTSADIRVVADGSAFKQGRLLPGSKIPVVAPEELPEDADDVLVLPWNIAAEILPLIGELVPGATSWSAVPEMRELS